MFGKRHIPLKIKEKSSRSVSRVMYASLPKPGHVSVINLLRTSRYGSSCLPPGKGEPPFTAGVFGIATHEMY